MRDSGSPLEMAQPSLSRRLAESNRCCDPRNQTVADQEGFVYVVETDDALKIGWTRQPAKRIDQLERQTGSYVHVWMCEPGTREDEQRAQAYWTHLLIRGVDWFQVDDELIAAAESGCLIPVRVGLLSFARRRDPVPA